MTHPLESYLRARGLTQAQFAKLSGVSKAVICRVLTGKRRRFSAEAAQAIEKATGGKVSFDDCWKPSLRHQKSRSRGSRSNH